MNGNGSAAIGGTFAQSLSGDINEPYHDQPSGTHSGGFEDSGVFLGNTAAVENFASMAGIFGNLYSVRADIYTSYKEQFGNGHPNIMATRFDYLRIAKAIMDDYQNDTCVGKYLKEIYKRRIPKGSKEKEEPLFNRTKSYGGQFHMDFPGLKDKIIFGMGGYGGNMILIDVENSRILVVNSLHYNNKQYKYNHKKLLLDPFKKGKQIN